MLYPKYYLRNKKKTFYIIMKIKKNKKTKKMCFNVIITTNFPSYDTKHLITYEKSHKISRSFAKINVSLLREKKNNLFFARCLYFIP